MFTSAPVLLLYFYHVFSCQFLYDAFLYLLYVKLWINELKLKPWTLHDTTLMTLIQNVNELCEFSTEHGIWELMWATHYMYTALRNARWKTLYSLNKPTPVDTTSFWYFNHHQIHSHCLLQTICYGLHLDIYWEFSLLFGLVINSQLMTQCDLQAAVSDSFHWMTPV